MYLLAGDIGGTNSRLLVAEATASEYQIIAEQDYPSNSYSGLLEVVEVFFAEYGITTAVDAACFAIAGPVQAGRVSVTNLPWVISAQELSERLQIPEVKLINDFVAVAHGIAELNDAQMLVLQHGETTSPVAGNADAAVIGAGTGLGVSHLLCGDRHCQPHPSEAGHVGFAPENQQQCKLLSWLLQQHSHVSVEMLLSGRGLATIYQYLKEISGLAESTAVRLAMQQRDPAQVITEHALAETDKLCSLTVDLFIDIYGSAAGNVALHYYPIGALYVAGGIAAKISNRLTNGRFMDAFLNKGAMSAVLHEVSVKLVTEEKAGLLGALSTARRYAI